MSSPFRGTGPRLAEFSTRVLRTDDRSFLYLRGEVDAYTAAVLRESLAELIGTGARHIVVDLRDLSFMSAAGLGVLVGAAKRLRGEDGSLVLRSAQPDVRRLVEITGLASVLPQL